MVKWAPPKALAGVGGGAEGAVALAHPGREAAENPKWDSLKWSTHLSGQAGRQKCQNSLKWFDHLSEDLLYTGPQDVQTPSPDRVEAVYRSVSAPRGSVPVS